MRLEAASLDHSGSDSADDDEDSGNEGAANADAAIPLPDGSMPPQKKRVRRGGVRQRLRKERQFLMAQIKAAHESLPAGTNLSQLLQHLAPQVFGGRAAAAAAAAERAAAPDRHKSSPGQAEVPPPPPRRRNWTDPGMTAAHMMPGAFPAISGGYSAGLPNPMVNDLAGGFGGPSPYAQLLLQQQQAALSLGLDPSLMTLDLAALSLAAPGPLGLGAMNSLMAGANFAQPPPPPGLPPSLRTAPVHPGFGPQGMLPPPMGGNNLDALQQALLFMNRSNGY